MVQFPFHGCREWHGRSAVQVHGTRSTAVARLVALVFVSSLAGCVTYEPVPLDVSSVLRALDAQQFEGAAQRASGAGMRPDELAAFAVTANPTLAAIRAEAGVGRALLVEAGLLPDPDPELGWDAMDVLASRIVDGTSSSVDVLSGFGLMFSVPRPGERDARVGAAESRVLKTRCRLATAEWNLTRDVYLAAGEVHAALELHAQTLALVGVAESTSDYFRRAREAGTATGIQANLALGELQVIRVEEVRAESREWFRLGRH